MPSVDYYITPDEYEKAERNGISKEILNKRVRVLGWKKERSINTPAPAPELPKLYSYDEINLALMTKDKAWYEDITSLRDRQEDEA